MELPRLAHSNRFVALVAMTLAAGCASSQDPAGDVVPDPLTDFTEPAALVDAHAQAIHDLDPERYAALLAPDFEFDPPSADLVDLPWIPSGSTGWDRETELRIIANMANPEFAGGSGGLAAIDATFLPLDGAPVADPLLVRCEADIEVVWAPSGTATAHTLLLFELATDERGFLRIARITETGGLGRSDPGPERTTWGMLKVRFLDAEDLP